jgi:hypothetical protein
MGAYVISIKLFGMLADVLLVPVLSRDMWSLLSYTHCDTHTYCDAGTYSKVTVGAGRGWCPYLLPCRDI